MLRSPLLPKILIGIYLFVYMVAGIYVELRLIERRPLSVSLLMDFGFYEDALSRALIGQDPYANRNVGTGYLYPPPALLFVEIFSHIEPFLLKVIVFIAVNVVLFLLMVYGIAGHFGYSIEKIWYWYVITLGFAPFLTLLLVGQINTITIFGVFLMFVWERKSPLLSGIGLGLAIVTKVSPIFLLGYLVFNKSYKAAVAAVVAIFILTLLSIFRYGLQPVLTYPDLFTWLLRQFPMGINSQSLVAHLSVSDWTRFQDFISPFPVFLQVIMERIFGFFTFHFIIVNRVLTLYIVSIIVVSGYFVFYGKQAGEALFIITMIGMTLAPNVMWHHHYIFLLLPLFVWMGWSRLSSSVVAWCLAGLMIIQIIRIFPPAYGLLIHIFGHLSMLSLLIWQWRQFKSGRVYQ